MNAGFSRVRITPPLGTRMSGFGNRDQAHGCEGVEDDLFVRALVLEEGGRRLVIAGYDLLFFPRALADRLIAAAAQASGPEPQAVLLNTSHTHSGPCVDDWGFNGYIAPDTAYQAVVEAATTRAVTEAVEALHAVRMKAGAGQTSLPVSRRKPDGKGGVEWRPYPVGEVCRHLPVVWLETMCGRPVCLLYSVSCHPSTLGGWRISADYPGVASSLLEAQFGAPALFLQGAGGDTKACVITNGHDGVDASWRSGTPSDVAAAGRLVADEVAAVIQAGLAPCEPRLEVRRTEARAPLREPLPGRTELEALRSQPAVNGVKRLWVDRQLEALAAGGPREPVAMIRVQALRLADAVRIVAIEGELVGELGNRILAQLGPGPAFVLGYSNGTGLYLPSTRMISENGYEVDSYFEYGYPAPLAPGWEAALDRAINQES